MKVTTKNVYVQWLEPLPRPSEPQIPRPREHDPVTAQVLPKALAQYMHLWPIITCV
jgi:hypothetical protein